LLSYDTSGTVVLPVRFANVRAEIDAIDRVTISWSNMTESEIQHYTIESSSDAVVFQPTGTILPTGNSGERTDYTYSSSQTAAITYYRIKATENSGSVLYSNVVVVRRNIPVTATDQSFSIYPNPVTGAELSLRLKNADPGRYILTVISPDGQAVRNKLIDHINGDLIRQIDMNGLAPGIYQLVLRNSSKKFTQQFLYVN
jgi:hypothetical protein